MTVQAIPYVLLSGLLFGTSLIASRFALNEFAPVTFTGLRLALASLGFLALYVVGRRRNPWPSNRLLWRHALLLGLVGTALPILGTVLALQFLSSGVTAMLVTVGPAITVLLAHFLLKDEQLTGRKIAGILLALSGALMLAVRGESGLPTVVRAGPEGYLLIFGVMVCVGVSTIYIRKYMDGYRIIDVSSTQMFVAAILVFPVALYTTDLSTTETTWRGGAALLYGSVAGTLFGLTIFNYNVKRFGATAAAMTQYVVPIVAAAGGIVMLGERVTAPMLLGITVIALGIGLIRVK